MKDLLNSLFGLNQSSDPSNAPIGFGSPYSEFTFLFPLESWVVVLIFISLISLVWWSYRKLPGSHRIRIVLASVRAIALISLLVISLGPMIVQTPTHIEQDQVLVLIDRSHSLNTMDSVEQSGSAQTSLVSRDEQLRSIFAMDLPRWDSLIESKHIISMGMSDSVSTFKAGALPEPDELPNLNGLSTSIGSSIDRAIESAQSRPISGIVLISDGRSNDLIPTTLTNQLKSDHIPIFTIPLGSSEPVPDLSIGKINAPSAAYINDTLPIRFTLDTIGIDPKEIIQDQLMIELRDRSTGEVLSTLPIDESHIQARAGALPKSDQEHTWITINHTPESPGEYQYDLALVGQSAESSTLLKDAQPTNNIAQIRVQIVDRPMRVLYIDGYPRWEQRYLKNLLIREPSIESSAMILSSNRRFIQDGDTLINSIPSTIDQWEPFDIIILGDLDPDLFSNDQLESLNTHINNTGAGLLWIAGPDISPSQWASSPIGGLLPMSFNKNSSNAHSQAWDTPVTMHDSQESRRLGLFNLNDDSMGWNPRLSDPQTGWSQFRWALKLDESSLRPGVSVLGYSQSISDQSDERAPLITSMRSGKGRSIFMGTDEIWRWRYGRGETLPERFWLPMIRLLGRGTIERRASSSSLVFSPQDPIVDQPTKVTLSLFDQELIRSLPDEIEVQIQSTINPDHQSTIIMHGNDDQRVGTWIPHAPGTYLVKLDNASPLLSNTDTQIRVYHHTDEQQLIDSDHELLESIAQSTLGRSVQPDQFDTIPDLLPNRARTIIAPPIEVSLWDRPFVLIFLVVLFTIEWIGRRSLRLA